MFARTSEIIPREIGRDEFISSEPPRQILEHTISEPAYGDGGDDALPSDYEVRRARFSRETAPPRRPRTATVFHPQPIASKCSVVRRVLTQIDQVARTPATVLLCGETGVGKEVFAQAIHDLSPRRDRPMIRVNCGAIPATLLESEFFGHERGAYTGAFNRQIGRFEAAHQSTLLLDEIGELPAAAQVKLLRVLQERVIERLGNPQPIKVDVRIIAATNIDLEQAVANGTFREDLFYRLNVFPILVPPLRERTEDIPALVWEFVKELAPMLNKRIDTIAPESMRELQRHRWPGNVRELRNTIERALIVATGPTLSVPVSPSRRTSGPATRLSASLQAS
jgi:transcriptional regulator with GAF, ATPase, and Fis domain